ncbi:MAG: hypothetical protein Q8S84_01260 [bacterium]|nr:hypothetical protein [bacterium]
MKSIANLTNPAILFFAFSCISVCGLNHSNVSSNGNLFSNIPSTLSDKLSIHIIYIILNTILTNIINKISI